jgi:serine protease
MVGRIDRDGVPANANLRGTQLEPGRPGACGSWQNASTKSSAGAIVVIAAGNSNANAANHQPVTGGVVTAAATDRDGNRAFTATMALSWKSGAPGVPTPAPAERVPST